MNDALGPEWRYAPTSLFVLGAPHSFGLFDEIEIFVDIFIRFVEFDVVIVDIVDRLRCVAKRHSASQKIKGDKFWVDFSNILGPTAKLILFTLKTTNCNQWKMLIQMSHLFHITTQKNRCLFIVIVRLV